ncbi:MAG TPA: lysophospholipid acyltransferase family protein [Alicycliphilus sp.]|nr:lysophospholipid acyltransferase family protein [Alicycliphilus sp.]
MALIRSLLHLLVMIITVIPYTTVILLVRLLGGSPAARYRVARAWLALCVDSARWIVGIRTRVEGMEHLPRDSTQGAVLLVKHQSAFETFLMPAIMPHALAYVFKKELLRIPFFGWSIGSLDMIHIDRSQKARAFVHVIKRGKQLLGQGVWVIMFPEGTRTARGEKGTYQASGARLAIEAGVPVVPVAVTSARCWPPKALVKTPGIVDVSIGRPIATAGRKSDELMREVEDWIESEMRRLDPDAYAPARDA